MSDEKQFKPSIAFLRKVAAGRVYKAKGYKKNRGGYYYTKGGEKQIAAHQKRGLIYFSGVADLGLPAYAKLTEAGLAILAAKEPTP